MFLKQYSEYFKSQINSLFQYYCDNKEVVTKARNITKNKQYYNSNHKIKDINEVLKIQKYIQDKLEEYYVKGRLDNKTIEKEEINSRLWKTKYQGRQNNWRESLHTDVNQ